MDVMIKAVGEWELEVRGIPYGSKSNKDSDGEYFFKGTELHEDKFPNPPVVYYHGYSPDGKPSGSPEYIGKTIGFEDRSDGRWYRVLLDKTSAFAKRVWQAAKDGKAFASSGSVSHLVRKASDGKILEWPVAELSVFDIGEGRAPANRYAVVIPVMKAIYEQADINLPDSVTTITKAETEGAIARGEAVDGDNVNHNKEEETIMSEEKDIQSLVADAVADALAKEQELRQQKEEAEKAQQEEIKSAVNQAVEETKKQIEEQYKASGRLPFNADNVPVVAKFYDTWKYDNMNNGELAFMINVLQEGRRSGRSREGASNASIKSLAIRIVEDAANTEAKHMLKSRGITDATKANEVQQSTLASYGDDFVPTFNSAEVWMNIVESTDVAAMLPAVTVPQGAESITIPVEGANPTFYKVAQASAQASNLGHPTATVTSSKKGTSNTVLAVNKMGASTLYTGELEEDSIVPWVPYIRNALVQEGAYTLDSIIIDGDTATGASTNINDIAGTPGGTEAFLLFNGLRKLALVTNTANGRSGGTLDENDFIETVKLMGLAGKNAMDKTQIAFLMDLHTYWKALQLAVVKTQDVYSNPTIENGELVRIWGYDVMKSAHMHRANQDTTYGLKANVAGKVDLDTAANNTKGALLAFRKDQWLLGYKRMMTIETQRYANADTTEIVALMRVGMINRDNEASAITYNITV